MAKFTAKQGEYLAFIRAFTAGFGFPPSESEIATALKVSPPSVNQMMKKLESLHLIRRKAGVPRSIEIRVSPEEIPGWNKRVMCTQKTWVLTGPVERGRVQSPVKMSVYRLKIVLKDTHPPIWRRIETKDVTLGELHELIQTAMGWTNSHLHHFKIGNTWYINPEYMDNEMNTASYAGMRISDLVSQQGTKLRFDYDYDFGDNWQHSIVLEKVTEVEQGVKYPRCIDGARACPPEDVGGVWGYVEFLKAITDPKHEQHDDFREWSGPLDPEKFNPKTATRRMRAALPVW